MNLRFGLIYPENIWCKYVKTPFLVSLLPVCQQILFKMNPSYSNTALKLWGIGSLLLVLRITQDISYLKWAPTVHLAPTLGQALCLVFYVLPTESPRHPGVSASFLFPFTAEETEVSYQLLDLMVTLRVPLIIIKKTWVCQQDIKQCSARTRRVGDSNKTPALLLTLHHCTATTILPHQMGGTVVSGG